MRKNAVPFLFKQLVALCDPAQGVGWQKVVKGIVLILAVSLDRIVQKSKAKASEKV